MDESQNAVLGKSQKKLHTVWVYLYDATEQAKLIFPDRSILVLPGPRHSRFDFKEDKENFQNDKNIISSLQLFTCIHFSKLI